jgi:hypothetical protein
MGNTDATRGFFGSLFDFSFHSFVFPKIVSFFYAFFLILLTLASIAVIVYAFASSDFSESSGMPGWVMLILMPIAWLLYVLVLRVWMEVAIVLFRIYENTDRIADRAEGGS